MSAVWYSGVVSRMIVAMLDEDHWRYHEDDRAWHGVAVEAVVRSHDDQRVVVGPDGTVWFAGYEPLMVDGEPVLDPVPHLLGSPVPKLGDPFLMRFDGTEWQRWGPADGVPPLGFVNELTLIPAPDGGLWLSMLPWGVHIGNEVFESLLFEAPPCSEQWGVARFDGTDWHHFLAGHCVIGTHTAVAPDDYWVVVPEGYADDAPAPLALWLSNADGSADANYAGWRPELEGIDVVFAVAGTRRRSDPEAMLALIDRLEAEYCIDTRRVHPMGSAWTAAPTAVLACAASERIASFYAGMGGFEVADCDPARSVPVLSMTGDADRAVVTQSIERWAQRNSCAGEPLVDDLGSGISRVTYADCAADVLLYDIEGIGHAFIFHECLGPAAAWCQAYAELDQLEGALRFFDDHPLPE